MPGWLVFGLGVLAGMVMLCIVLVIGIYVMDRKDRRMYDYWQRNHREMWGQKGNERTR